MTMKTNSLSCALSSTHYKRRTTVLVTRMAQGMLFKIAAWCNCDRIFVVFGRHSDGLDESDLRAKGCVLFLGVEDGQLSTVKLKEAD